MSLGKIGVLFAKMKGFPPSDNGFGSVRFFESRIQAPVRSSLRYPCIYSNLCKKKRHLGSGDGPMPESRSTLDVTRANRLCFFSRTYCG